jgi:putative addiction module killer protein
MLHIVHYEQNGHDLYQEWIDNLRDQRGRKAIHTAIDRASSGNFGVHRFCRSGVWELVIDTGPGYRVYYSMIGNTIILLLCAGDKKTQQKDIDRAIGYLQNFRKENNL